MAVVSALIAIVSLTAFVFNLASARLTTKTSRINSLILAFLTVWLLATQIPLTLFYATRHANVRAFLGGQELPAALVQGTEEALGVSDKYSDKDYRKLLSTCS